MNPVPMIVILIVCLALAFILADKKVGRIKDDGEYTQKEPFSKRIDLENKQEENTP